MHYKPVVLTSRERHDAALAAQEATDKGMRHYGVVDAVVRAINANRQRD